MAISAEDRIRLLNLFKEEIRFDEPMRKHTSFRIGGPVDALINPSSQKSLIGLVDWCRKRDMPYFILGKGTNLLVKDRGFRGVAISLEKCLNRISEVKPGRDSIEVSAMAGVGLQRLCGFAIKKGLAGLNFALGIPGSVGGGIMMNAGTADGCMADVVASLDILFPSGKTKRFPREKLDFSYREFSLSQEIEDGDSKRFIILKALFRLYEADPEMLKEDGEKRLRQRKANQPVNAYSPGCLFKNPGNDLSAGRLIDEAGLKGERSGDAQISELHANYIVNRGRATASDVLDLMSRVQDKVFKRFNVMLEPEVVILGE